MEEVFLRVSSQNLKEFNDIRLNKGVNKISLFKCKDQLLSIVSKIDEYEIEVNLNEHSILSKIVSYKKIEKRNRSFFYLMLN